MDVVTLRVFGYGKRKDFHFSVAEEAAKFEEYMRNLDEDNKLTYEVLSSSINNNIANIRELGRKPELYAEKAYRDIISKRKK